MIEWQNAGCGAGHHSLQPRHAEELAPVETELHKVEKNIAHYMRAFEAETMPEGVCGPRLVS